MDERTLRLLEELRREAETHPDAPEGIEFFD